MSTDNQTPSTDDKTQTFNPQTNPRVREALSLRYSNSTILLLPLRDQSIAVFGRDFLLHKILEEMPSFNELQQLSIELRQKLTARSAFAAEQKFYGEPGVMDLARDLKHQRRAENYQPKQNTGRPSQAIDLDL